MTSQHVILFIALAIAACRVDEPATVVHPGIDVLLEDSVHLVAGRRVGILTNAAAVDRRGIGTLDRLLDADLQVTAIFSPEHGFRVLREGPIGDARDSVTGLPIFSLYGANSRPTSAALDLIDVLLIDLPDIGARTYTYASTMLLAMEAAADVEKLVVVLDRPNPIGGVLVQGPLLDERYASNVGMLPFPTRHGLTLGEIARYGRMHRDIGVDLVVVPVRGWRRSLWFDGTGLPWVNPSPSMPSVESATHYPGLVIFEATALSVGRGTPVAFQVVGAPWLDVEALLGSSIDARGVELRDTTVTPHEPPDGKFPDVRIPAVRLVVTDRATYDPVATASSLFLAIARNHGDALAIRPQRLARLWGSMSLFEALTDTVSSLVLRERWEPDLEAFRVRRREFLVYPD